jgi:hypothetical protein
MWSALAQFTVGIANRAIIEKNMLKTIWATVRHGKIELRESVELPEGTKVLVTLLPDDEDEFWLQASQTSLDTVWDNTEDDVYAQLL